MMGCRAAISTGAVNLVLPVGEIPKALARYARHPYVTAGLGAASADKDDDISLSEIIELLRARTSRDFTHYRKATLLRRIRRRMAAAGTAGIEAYVRMVREDGHELEQLAKDFLIHVTSFFRDAAAFEGLAKTVMPEDQPIRVWVVGCGTGEEAYSLAMLFLEEFSVAKRTVKLQIFASDIGADALEFRPQRRLPEVDQSRRLGGTAAAVFLRIRIKAIGSTVNCATSSYSRIMTYSPTRRSRVSI